MFSFLFFDFLEFPAFFCFTVWIRGTVVVVLFLAIFISWSLCGDLIGMFNLLKAVNGFLVVLGVLSGIKPPRSGAGGLLVASVMIAVSAGASCRAGLWLTPTGGLIQPWPGEGEPGEPQRVNFSAPAC